MKAASVPQQPKVPFMMPLPQALAAALLAVPMPLLAQEAGPLADLLRGTHVHGLALDPADPERLFVATHHGLHALDLSNGEVVPVGESRDDFMGFSVGGGGQLFASGHPAGGGNAGVLRSTDGGETWEAITEGAGGPVDFHQMTASVADPQTLYGAYAGSLQQSRDSGRSWEVVGPAPEGLIDLAASALDPEHLYAATESGLLGSEDGGATWAPRGPWTGPVSFVEAGPDASLHAFVVGEGLVRAGEESLEDWTTVSPPLGGDYLLHFAASGERAFAVTGSGMLLASEDGGQSWRPL